MTMTIGGVILEDRRSSLHSVLLYTPVLLSTPRRRISWVSRDLGGSPQLRISEALSDGESRWLDGDNRCLSFAAELNR
ncbi:hypothetical protein F2Q69_00031690 [Brassica cretica]|uniref:Uncharacterized protein n=1 Tax=Brassica cretica TaxID=69181 RepID=A0A8S9RZG6_BRACR|nr:hypothetical protein F2Q69_00031690 [Brassica cretica]